VNPHAEQAHKYFSVDLYGNVRGDILPSPLEAIFPYHTCYAKVSIRGLAPMLGVQAVKYPQIRKYCTRASVNDKACETNMDGANDVSLPYRAA